MKKKLLIAMIPVLGMGALVGSGFSAWVFAGTANNELGFNGTITVTPAASNLSIAFENYKMSDEAEDQTISDDSISISATLDQGTNTNSDGVLTPNASNAEGIKVTTPKSFTFTITLDEDTAITDGSHKVQMYFDFSLSGTVNSSSTSGNSFNNYLTLDDEMANLEFGTSESYADLGVSTSPTDLVANKVSYVYDDNGKWTFTVTLPDQNNILNYVAKPTTYAEWEKMNDDLAGQNFDINFTVGAKVVPNN